MSDYFFAFPCSTPCVLSLFSVRRSPLRAKLRYPRLHPVYCENSAFGKQEFYNGKVCLSAQFTYLSYHRNYLTVRIKYSPAQIEALLPRDYHTIRPDPPLQKSEAQPISIDPPEILPALTTIPQIVIRGCLLSTFGSPLRLVTFKDKVPTGSRASPRRIPVLRLTSDGSQGPR